MSGSQSVPRLIAGRAPWLDSILAALVITSYYSSLITHHSSLITASMTPERWKQVNELFHSALERAPAQRATFLDEVCADDEELRREVDSLIRFHEQTGNFMDSPAYEGAAARMLSEDQRELVEGQVLGQYKILSLLGAGGMGEVYLAHDTKLARKVALKLLPASFTKDEERVRRFEQEARAASALNHPNILTIHDIDEVEGLRFIAAEYVEGNTLRQRMSEQGLILGEAIDVAIQVAGALKAAHQAGIIHRDIKPENLMLRPDGYVKVLDFGLAKLTERRMTVADAQSPTVAAVKTDTGVVMGTAHYMSPEQARGIAVDHRTDLFSLGVVLYEMVTGRVPFAGKTPSHVIVAILETEPVPLASHLPGAPAELQRMVSKALAKDREERYEKVEDLLIDLKGLRQGLESEAQIVTVMAPATGSRHKSERISGKKAFTVSRSIWLAAALMLVMGGTAWLYFSRSASEPPLPPMKITPFTSFPGFEFGPSFSPDGNFMAFCWGGEKNDNIDIYIQRIGSSGPPFRLTDDPAMDFLPVWSPDGSEIAFSRFKSESEKASFIKPALGGPERKFNSPSVKAIWGGDKHMDWSSDGRFIVAPDKLSPEGPYHIFLISPETFEKHPLTFPPDHSFGDLHSQFSPDSQSVAFVRGSSLQTQDLYVVPVGGGEPRRLTFDNRQIQGVAWTVDGREIVFSSDRGGMRSLWKVSATGGPPQRLPVGESGATFPAISRERNRLAFVQKITDTNIYRISLNGPARLSNPPSKFAPSTRLDWHPEFSPDGKRVAFESERSGQHEIWLCDSDGSNLVRLTFFATWSGSPAWSPDSQQIAFDSRELGGAAANIYVISSQGGSGRLLTADDEYDDVAPSWSRDGRWIYFTSNRSGDWQVWKVPAEGGEAVQITKRGGFVGFEAPDGKSFYYAKAPRSLPGIWRVPVDGGDEVPVLDSVAGYWGNWALVDDGIYYIEPETKNGAAIEFFSFATRRITEVALLGKVNVSWVGFAVSPDRQSLLYTLVDHDDSEIMLVENFR